MIVEFSISGDIFYYEIDDDVAKDLKNLQGEFSEMLNNIKGTHPFREYHEIVEENKSISFAGYINVFGVEDFLDWISVEKCNRKIGNKIHNQDCLYNPDLKLNF
ncbi:hypothetical protein [Paenibacillus sp. GCM10028914]|uniref:hypothetical protein n=1 Tax=Paenibacillus sp. GCM10028914 TaxID=3273416 RepID=UPI00361DF29A